MGFDTNGFRISAERVSLLLSRGSICKQSLARFGDELGGCNLSPAALLACEASLG
jgi:hypothetical protein